MLSQTGRLATKTQLQLLKSWGVRYSWVGKERVSALTAGPLKCNKSNALERLIPAIAIGARFYADGAVSRPKAHTGRPRGTTKSAAKKPASTGAKSKSSTKSKAKAKPKKKTRAKAKAKPKPKRKVLTAAQKESRAKKTEATKLRDLRKKALLKAPKEAPSSAWTVYSSERTKSVLRGKSGPSTLGTAIKEIAAAYKQLTPEQLEHYNRIANQNKEANAAAYRKWISSYSPKEINEANSARTTLSRLQGKKNSQKFTKLKDERLVTRPRTAYIAFSQARFASGEFKGLSIPEASRLAAREWKALSDSDRKPYLDNATKEKERYKQEAQTVYTA